jgi:hypothetical protein
MGLLSLALQDEMDCLVTGTIVKTNIGEDALEVVFALREVCLRSFMLSSITDPTYRLRPRHLVQPSNDMTLLLQRSYLLAHPIRDLPRLHLGNQVLAR